jgi:hypothetical protein
MLTADALVLLLLRERVTWKIMAISNVSGGYRYHMDIFVPDYIIGAELGRAPVTLPSSPEGSHS